MKYIVPESIPVSLFFPKSGASTDVNRTGTWSFMRPRYLEKTAPCAERCPCGEDIPRIEMLASRGFHIEAWRTILEENPLPGVCGRVCFHPCEGACNRGEFDTPVSINALERFLDDAAAAVSAPENIGKRARTGKRVAIAGSGPAGLAAAYFLARLGHECEIFEAEREPGGVLRGGIPSYRLPPEVLDREIARIEALGVRIHCGEPVDPGFLRTAKSRFDAVFLSCGNGRASRLGIPGEDLAVSGLSFLASAKRAALIPGAAGKTALVIGGGNTAVDTARTLLRFGVSPVIVYRRRREDMPAFGHEIERALEEGVRLAELRAPVSLAKTENGLELTVQRTRPAGIGPDGRTRAEPVAGAFETLTADQVYSAAGAGPSESWMLPPDAPSVRRFGRCAAAWRSDAGVPVLYGGDVVVSEESAADAIGSGKEAALALDLFFSRGEEAVEAGLARCRIGNGPSVSMEIHLGGPRSSRASGVVKMEDINTGYFSGSPRERGAEIPARQSAGSFAEIEAALEREKAAAQAGRCFNCGICNDCDNCRTFCPEAAVSAARAAGAPPTVGAGPDREIFADYCKGCGICAAECPRGAMIIEELQS